MEKQSISLANLLKKKYEIIKYSPPYLLQKLPLLGKFYISKSLEKIFLDKTTPKYVITCGKRMAGVSIYLKSKLKNKIKILHIQNPGIAKFCFDLLLIPEHDHVNGINVIKTKGALTFFKYDTLKNRYDFLKQDNTKLVLLMVGGENKRYSPHSIDYFNLSMKVIKSLKNFNAKLLVSFSRRTPKKAISIIDKSFSKYLKSYEILPMSENNPYPDILKNIDYAIVTSDSVNMISEISTTPIPLFIHKFPKESGKILYFLNDLQNLGIIKIFENELFQFNKKQLNTNRTTLLKVNKFLGL